MNKFILVILFLVVSCSTITIGAKKVDLEKHSIKLICIENNPKVLVSDFVDAVREELAIRKIKSKVVLDNNFTGCKYKLN